MCKFFFRDYKSTRLQDHKWAVAGCFKTTRPRVYKTRSRAVADGFKTTSQRVNKTTSKVVAVLPFDFRLLSFTLCLSTIKKTENSTLLARPHPCIPPYRGILRGGKVVGLSTSPPIFRVNKSTRQQVGDSRSVVLKKNVLRRLTMKSTRSLVDLLS